MYIRYKYVVNCTAWFDSALRLFLNDVSIGFTKVCTIEDIQKAYPFLDMVDHDNRKRVVRTILHEILIVIKYITVMFNCLGCRYSFCMYVHCVGCRDVPRRPILPQGRGDPDDRGAQTMGDQPPAADRPPTDWRQAHPGALLYHGRQTAADHRLQYGFGIHGPCLYAAIRPWLVPAMSGELIQGTDTILHGYF